MIYFSLQSIDGWIQLREFRILFWKTKSWLFQRRDVCNSVPGAAQLSSSPSLLFSPSLMLAASAGSPQWWPLASLSNDLIFPSCLPPCHLSLSLPSFPGDEGMEDLGGKGADEVCLSSKLCIFFPQQLSAPFNQSSCPSVLYVSWLSLFLLPLSLI